MLCCYMRSLSMGMCLSEQRVDAPFSGVRAFFLEIGTLCLISKGGLKQRLIFY